MKQRSMVPGVVAVAMILIALICAAEDVSIPAAATGSAVIIHRSDVIKEQGTNSVGSMRLWPLLSTPEARMNYVEVTGRSGSHFHPDADHRLYVLEGNVVVRAGTNTTVAVTGDLIIIPKGVTHSYDVPGKGDRALLLTFDAPPYDPGKTVAVKTQPSK